MRALLLLLLPLLAGCANSAGNAPSLSPRPAEAIDPRVAVPERPLSTIPNPGLVAQLDTLVAQALAGDQAFQPLIDRAGQLAGSAGARGSESWISAQQALSAAVAARSPVARSLGDIDALAAKRVQAVGGIAAADLKAIQAAAARVATIDSSEAQRVAEIQARLGG